MSPIIFTFHLILPVRKQDEAQDIGLDQFDVAIFYFVVPIESYAHVAHKKHHYEMNLCKSGERATCIIALFRLRYSQVIGKSSHKGDSSIVARSNYYTAECRDSGKYVTTALSTICLYT